MTKLLLPNGPLVSTEWLAGHLHDANLRVIDIRGKVLPAGTTLPRYQPKRAEYEAAHLPRAAFIDWTKDIIDPDDPVPAQIAPPERFAHAMEAIGVGDDTAVVAYDDYNAMFAGRLAWALRFYGHDDVRILDGGFALWAREGRPLTTDATPAPAPRVTFTPRARPPLRRTADEVASRPADALLIDARPPDQFEGKVSAARRMGHIPGARNVPYAKLIDATTGRFLPVSRLREVFAASGVDLTSPPNEVVVYCNGGVSATVPLTALALLGRTDVAVYDGSWNEWGNDEARPIATGSS
jgi:thiosulfate/3-mercaptopyruvate sulfurtransferase